MTIQDSRPILLFKGAGRWRWNLIQARRNVLYDTKERGDTVGWKKKKNKTNNNNNNKKWVNGEIMNRISFGYEDWWDVLRVNSLSLWLISDIIISNHVSHTYYLILLIPSSYEWTRWSYRRDKVCIRQDNVCVCGLSSKKITLIIN